MVFSPFVVWLGFCFLLQRFYHSLQISQVLNFYQFVKNAQKISLKYAF